MFCNLEYVVEAKAILLFINFGGVDVGGLSDDRSRPTPIPPCYIYAAMLASLPDCLHHCHYKPPPANLLIPCNHDCLYFYANCLVLILPPCLMSSFWQFMLWVTHRFLVQKTLYIYISHVIVSENDKWHSLVNLQIKKRVCIPTILSKVFHWMIYDFKKFELLIVS